MFAAEKCDIMRGDRPDKTAEDTVFNIFVYKTGYDHVRLVSSENFDTKDNDYIQYKLLFTRS